jgi:hypothetical protein
MKLELSKKYFKILLLLFSLLTEKNFYAAVKNSSLPTQGSANGGEINNSLETKHEKAIESKNGLLAYISNANKANAEDFY